MRDNIEKDRERESEKKLHAQKREEDSFETSRATVNRRRTRKESVKE
jgi:hypothetical protein